VCDFPNAIFPILLDEPYGISKLSCDPFNSGQNCRWLDYLLSLSLPSDIDDIAEERYIHATTGRLFILSMARKAPHDSPLAIVVGMCQVE